MFTQATPAALDLSAYPKLKITATDAALQLSTDTVPSGYVLVTVTNQTTGGSADGSSLLGPSAGMSFADFQAQVQQRRQAGASPVAESTPQAGGGGLPKIAYTAAILGGPGTIDPGQTGQAIVSIPAGQWFVTGNNHQPFALLTATEGSPGAMAEPAAAVTITEIDFSFAGFGHVPAGPQVWKVVNTGAQPHMLVLFGVPAGTTLDQVLALINAPQDATPIPGGLDPNAVQDMGGANLQSAGTTAWPVLNLPAGRYAAACFVPDSNKNGEPHAMEGMTSVFDAGM